LRSIIRAPGDEGNLGPSSLAALKIVFDVEDGITATDALLAAAVLALSIQELLAEGVEVGVVGGFFDDDFFPVVGDLVDDPFEVFAELELVELGDAVGVD